MKNLRKLFAICLTLAMVLMMVACQPTAKTSAGANTNVFVGEAQGHNGPIKVEVTLENNELKEIKVLEHQESDFTKSLLEELPKTMVAGNTADVDIIAGATVTTNALMEAVKNALAQAGVTLTAKGTSAESSQVEDASTDIVIIGAGGAGLAAAIEAKTLGAEVIVVEKSSFVGGNTNYATAGMNAANTKHQAAQGIEDSAELFYADTMKGGYDINNPELVKTLAENSADIIDWLENLGADLSKVSRTGGQTADRTHTTKDGSAIGSHLIQVFEENVKKLDIDVRLNTKAVEILSEGNKTTGIKVETSDGQSYIIHAKAVIIASGGFGASQEMVVKFNPELEGFGTTNHPGATGDAFNMVEALNVALVDMEQIQTHPTVVPEKNVMITEAVRGEGAILVNRAGKRFVNELETRDVVSEAMLNQEGKTGFLIFDASLEERLAAVKKYNSSGLLADGATIQELAGKIGANAEELEKTINTYNTYFVAQEDPEFERRALAGDIAKAPFYAVEVGPAIHHTMGGIKINTKTEVLNDSDSIIEGLFAAGEVTGGIHGGNRLGGNAVADIMIFGKIAGQNAAAFVK